MLNCFLLQFHIYLPLIRLRRQDEYFGKYFVTSFCAWYYYSKRISFSFLIYNYFSLFFLCFRGRSYLHITNFLLLLFSSFLLSIKSLKDLKTVKLKAKSPILLIQSLIQFFIFYLYVILINVDKSKTITVLRIFIRQPENKKNKYYYKYLVTFVAT